MESTLSPKDNSLQEVPISNLAKDIISPGKNLKKSYACTICKKICSRKDNLNQHMLVHSKEKTFLCDICEKPFARKSDLKRHKLFHLKIPTHYKCNHCLEEFSRKLDLFKHRKSHAKPPTMYNCKQCTEVFSSASDLLKHKKSHVKPPVKYNCKKCSEIFMRKSDLLKHEKTHRSLKQYKCDQCDEMFSSKSKLLHHIRTFHTASSKRAENGNLKDALFEKVKHFPRKNALGVFTETIIKSNSNNDKDFHVFFNSIKPDILNELSFQLEEKKRFKWYAVVQVVVSRTSNDGVFETASPFFQSGTFLQLTNHNLSSNMEGAFAKIINSFEKFTSQGSSWTLDKIVHLQLSTAKYAI